MIVMSVLLNMSISIIDVNALPELIKKKPLLPMQIHVKFSLFRDGTTRAKFK